MSAKKLEIRPNTQQEDEKENYDIFTEQGLFIANDKCVFHLFSHRKIYIKYRQAKKADTKKYAPSNGKLMNIQLK